MSASSPNFHITPVQTPSDLAATTALFEAYADSLNLDLSFQSFATELATLPGAYAPPTGTLLLARPSSPQSNDSGTLGCVALRPLDPSARVAELKRLYVSPRARGTGVGKALVLAVLAEARRLGYRAVRLDTLPSMISALGLYRSLGFREIGAYYQTPVEGTVFLELWLRGEGEWMGGEDGSGGV